MPDKMRLCGIGQFFGVIILPLGQSGVYPIKQMINQEADIFASLTQRRHLKDGYCQAVKKIFPKSFRR